MGHGWIKLHRKLLDNPIMRRPTWLSVWITLLLMANHKPTRMIWNNTIVVVKEGQLITGRDALSKATGVHRSSIERILDYLENEHQIEQQKTTKYRLITILNWKDYQREDTEASNKRATNEQQASTNNNDKKDKNLNAGYRVVPVEEKEKKVTPEMREVFSLFGKNPARITWGARVAERNAAAVLHETYGIEELKRRYALTQKYRDEENCPQIDTPTDFLDKMPKMEKFLKSL